jgi:hypothetical protein
MTKAAFSTAIPILGFSSLNEAVVIPNGPTTNVPIAVPAGVNMAVFGFQDGVDYFLNVSDVASVPAVSQGSAASILNPQNLLLAATVTSLGVVSPTSGAIMTIAWYQGTGT